jgi:hypothetical protein
VVERLLNDRRREHVSLPTVVAVLLPVLGGARVLPELGVGIVNAARRRETTALRHGGTSSAHHPTETCKAQRVA